MAANDLIDSQQASPLLLGQARDDGDGKGFLCYNQSDYKEVKVWWSFVWPTMILFFCTNSMTLVDMAFVGHLSTDYLAAAALAGMLFDVSNAMFARCFIQVLAVLCSQAYGSGKHKLMGRWLQLAIVVCCVFGIPISAMYWYAAEILDAIVGVSEELRGPVNTFSRWSILRLYPRLVYGCLQQFCISQKVIRPLVYLNLISVVMNVVFNQVLIHGFGTWEGFGFQGSPMATALTSLLICLLMIVYLFVWRVDIVARTWQPWSVKESVRGDRLAEFLKQAGPLSIAICFEMFQIQSVGLFVVQLSHRNGNYLVSTHSGLISLFGTLCAFQGGVLRGTSVRVSHYIGGQDAQGAQKVMRLAFSISSIIGAVISAFIFAFRHELPHLYSNDVRVWDETADLLIIVAFGYFLCVVFYLSMAVLDAQGRPQIVALAFFCGSWVIALPIIYMNAFWFDFGLFGIWVGLIIGYIITSLVLSYFVLRTDWNEVLEDASRRNNLHDDSESVASSVCMASGPVDQMVDSVTGSPRFFPPSPARQYRGLQERLSSRIE